MANKINFFRGDKNDYHILRGVNTLDDVYFATDTKEILMGGETYGGLTIDAYTKAESDAKYLTEHLSLSNYATKADVTREITTVVDNAPEELNTLKEIADRLLDDEDVTAGIIRTLATKQNKLTPGEGISIDGNVINGGLRQVTWNKISDMIKDHPENYVPGKYITISPSTEGPDINKDGVTDIADLAALASIIMGDYDPELVDKDAADINSDGSIDVIDITKLVDILIASDKTSIIIFDYTKEEITVNDLTITVGRMTTLQRYTSELFVNLLTSNNDIIKSTAHIPIIKSSQGIGLEYSNSGTLKLLGGIKYVDFSIYADNAAINGKEHWNTPELCQTLAPVVTGLDQYDYNNDGIVDAKDILLFGDLNPVIVKEETLNKVLDIYNVSYEGLTFEWKKTKVKEVLLANNKAIDANGDGTNFDVNDLAYVINVFLGRIQVPKTIIGYDLIFFNVTEGSNGNFVKEDVCRLFISSDDISTQISNEVHSQIGDIDGMVTKPTGGFELPVQRAFARVPVEDPEEGDPAYTVEEQSVYSLSHDLNDFIIDDNNVLHIAPNAGSYNLPYTFEYSSLNLSDPTTWYGTFYDEEVLDELLEADELPANGISFSYIDSNLGTLTVVCAKDISRLNTIIASSLTHIDCIVCHFNLVYASSSNPYNMEDKRACLLLAKSSANSMSTYHWAIGIEGLTNPLNDAFLKIPQTYRPV